MKRISVVFLLLTTAAWAVAEPGKDGFTYQGRVFNGSNVPMTGTVDITFKIMSPNGCVLYVEKQQSINLTSSHGDGYFAVQIGSAVGAAKRLAGSDPGKSMAAVFTNDSTTWTAAWGATPGLVDDSGAACTYTPTAGDSRALRVKIYNPSSGGNTVLSPDLIIAGPANAFSAETLSGIPASSFLQTKAAKNLSQTSLEVLTNNEDASSLHNHDSLYAKLTGSDSLAIAPGSYLSLGAQASNPGSLGGGDAGKIWYNSTDKTINYYDGSTVKTLGTSGVVSFNGRTGAVSLSTADVQNVLGVASGTSHGYVTSTDWTAFNNATSAVTGNKAQNSVFAGPGSGGAGAASFRALVADDIPSLDWSKIGSGKPTTLAGYGITDGGGGSVTTVGLSLPAQLTVTGSPVSSSGTISASWASQTQKTVFAAPNAADGVPTFRTLLESDLPSLSSAGKVANTATTAASANTASAIVARDANGNFSAGTITATFAGSITGNVTGNVSGTAATAFGLASGTTGGIPYFSGASTMSSSAALGNFVVLTTNGSGVPAPVGPGTSNQVFVGNTGAAPSFRALGETDLPTISTAGKVSGGAITSGTIGGTTVISTSGTMSVGATAIAGTLTTTGGAVTIGTTGAPQQLAVNGVVVSPIVSSAITGTASLSLSSGNVFLMSNYVCNGGTITLQNAVAGGSYTLIMPQTHTGACNFVGNDGSTVVKFSGGATGRTPNTTGGAVFTFLFSSANVGYGSMVDNMQ